MAKSGHWLGDPQLRARRLQGPAARRVLEALQATPAGLTAAQLAAVAHIGTSYVQDILAAAMRDGLVVGTPDPAPGGRKGRPPWRYRPANPL